MLDFNEDAFKIRKEKDQEDAIKHQTISTENTKIIKFSEIISAREALRVMVETSNNVMK